MAKECKNFGAPKFKACWWAQQKAPQIQSQLLQAGQSCKFRTGTNAVCWMLSLLFHLSVSGNTIILSFRGTESTPPFLLTSGFAFKSLLQEQPELQIHFLAWVWATVTLSKHPLCQHHQLLWKWETNCVTSWRFFSLNFLVTHLSSRESLNSCLPSQQKIELPQHTEQKTKISLVESC